MSKAPSIFLLLDLASKMNTLIKKIVPKEYMHIRVLCIVAVFVLVGCTSIDSFEQCVQEGYEVQETFPAQCHVRSTIFIEDVQKEYRSQNLQECRVAQFSCPVGYPFFDHTGCGCVLDATPTPQSCEDISLECQERIQPVCGWYNQSVQCVAEPCAVQASDPCEICDDPRIAYYTFGACPRS
ncbi:MAG: hypothetical protein ACMXYF_00765 [Candidatus Woesearchaeota archaeon]